MKMKNLEKLNEIILTLNPVIETDKLWETVGPDLLDDELSDILLDILSSESSQNYFDEGHHRQKLSVMEKLNYQKSIFVANILAKIFSQKIPDNYHNSLLEKNPPDEFISLSASDVIQDGFSILPQLLSPEIISELISELDTLSFRNRILKKSYWGKDLRQYQKNHSGTWWLEKQDKITSIDIFQKIALDSTLLRIAEKILGTAPIHVQTNAWWSFSQNKKRSKKVSRERSRNAQFFHQDQEFITFVKIFIYLTDVEMNNGPHVYVKGSADDYEQKLPAWTSSSQRIDDETITAAFGEDRIIPITGRAGQISIVNTRGYHKGAPVMQGSRLMLQLEYASSLYSNPVESFSKHSLNKESCKLEKSIPRIFLNYRDIHLEDNPYVNVENYKKPGFFSRLKEAWS